jgi:hypothetical protein
MREALERVCGVAASRASLVSIEEEVQYALKPAQPNAVSMEDFEVPSAMSPRTALLAGLLLGVTVMIGILGAIAWRARSPEPDPNMLVPAASSSMTAPAAAPDAR